MGRDTANAGFEAFIGKWPLNWGSATSEGPLTGLAT